ncbi:MAG: ribulose bisphosphate carboxylase small subunit [Gammaproteobacteria bacterium]
MQSGHSHASVVKLNYLNEIERHIENTLSDNWIIRVEHTQDVNPVHTQWQQWGIPLYCVKDARTVTRSIQDCRAEYPMHSVRLYAEKTSPRMRFIYPVYRPEGSTGSAQVLPGKWIAQASRSGGDWLKSLGTGVIAALTRLRRIIIVTGMLLGSFLVFEEVVA